MALAVTVVLADLQYSPGGPLRRALSLGPVVWVGQISYSLYLWHYPLLSLSGTRLARWAGPGAPWVCVAASVVAAAFSYYVIEKPALRLKERFAWRAPAKTPSP